MIINMIAAGPDWSTITEADVDHTRTLANVTRAEHATIYEFDEVKRALLAALRWQFDRHPERLLADDLANVIQRLVGNSPQSADPDYQRVMERYREARA